MIKSVKIGLPRALMYHYYYPLWRTLFEALGFEVVTSDRTSKTLIAPGISVTVPEICLPIKIFNAHVIDTLKKGADFVFVPRLVSIEKGLWCCPKYLGLPELVGSTVPGIEGKMVSAYIEGNTDDTATLKNYEELCEPLGVSKKELKAALGKAKAVWESFRAVCRKGYSIEEADAICFGGKPESKFKRGKSEITIGLLGYVYNVYDPFVSMDAIGKLREMGAEVITFDMLDEKMLKNKHRKDEKQIFWSFSDRLYQTAATLVEEGRVDGLIHITAFGCGPDSLVGRLVELDFDHYGKPFMTLRVDEHTGESHLLTRLEAFTDMLKRKKLHSAKEAAGL